MLEVHVAALLLLQEGGVDEPTVDELMLVEVWGEKGSLARVKGRRAVKRGSRGKDGLMTLPWQAVPASGYQTLSKSRRHAARYG